MKKMTLSLLFFTSFVFSQGNPATGEANIDDVYNQFNLTGENVIFASIERGIDYTHPAYLNPDGTTRIAYIFDMTNPAGASDSNNPYGTGTIFTEADVNASLIAGGTPISMDRFGHGTACTGIVAGNGAGTTNMEFQGVAPNATLIIVKMIQDGFPPFGSEPGEVGYFNPTDIPIALDFVHDKVTELGLPSVTLMNFGSIGGPTDGTSTISRAMDDFIAQGHILVCGVGDDGGNDNHASSTIPQNTTQEIEISKLSGGVRFDLWYSENDRFEVSVELPNGTIYGPFPAPLDPNGNVTHFLPELNLYHRGANLDFFGATSNTRELLIDFFGANGTHKVILTATTVNDIGTFNASLNPSTYFNDNRFLTHVVPGYSINDYASAFNVIVPSDYVVDNSWTDINGVPRSLTGQGNSGDLWIGSSSGPTYDGRQGVDFVAPGEVIFAPYSPNTYYANFAFNLVQGGNGLYGIQNAVSAAAPLSCGVIALMLELDPTLTNQEVKDILRQTAREDASTGTVPNTTWGNGKLDALAAVEEVNDLLSIETNIEQLGINVYPNPVTDVLNITTQKTIEDMSIYSLDGKLITYKIPFSKSIDVSFLTSGFYIFKLKTRNATFNVKLLKR